jgi:hypothetical protein
VTAVVHRDMVADRVDLDDTVPLAAGAAAVTADQSARNTGVLMRTSYADLFTTLDHDGTSSACRPLW